MKRDPLRDPAPLVKAVYAYVAYRVGAGPDAEDVTSEAFERALRYRDSYDSALGTPLAWLIGITRRVLADRGARREGREESSLPDDLNGGSPFEDVSDRRLTVRSAVANLPARDRELIGLRYGADLSVREIATLLGLETNAVDVALHRARRRVAGELHLLAPNGGRDGVFESVRILPDAR
jgi:RNA polymerase sigma factor (sigma-70 family)